jgi:hypothetical protein
MGWFFVRPSGMVKPFSPFCQAAFLEAQEYSMFVEEFKKWTGAMMSHDVPWVSMAWFFLAH